MQALKAGHHKEIIMANEAADAVEELSLSDETPAGGTPAPETPPSDGGTPPAAEDRGDNFTPTPDDDDDAPAAESAAPAKKGGIPPERLSEVTQQRNAEKERADAAERELQALRDQLAKQRQAAPAAAQPEEPAAAPEPVFDLKAKQKEAADALLEGDMDRYTELQSEIYTHIGQQAVNTALRTSREATAQETEQAAINSVAAKAYESFPFLDVKSDQANAEAIDDVRSLRDGYIAKGMRASEALQKAVEKVGKLYGSPATDQAAPTGGSKAQDQRPAAAAARAAAIDGSQPPIPTGGLGDRATAGRVNVANMSETEFRSLSEADKKRLRGD